MAKAPIFEFAMSLQDGTLFTDQVPEQTSAGEYATLYRESEAQTIAICSFPFPIRPTRTMLARLRHWRCVCSGEQVSVSRIREPKLWTCRQCLERGSRRRRKSKCEGQKR